MVNRKTKKKERHFRTRKYIIYILCVIRHCQFFSRLYTYVTRRQMHTEREMESGRADGYIGEEIWRDTQTHLGARLKVISAELLGYGLEGGVDQYAYKHFAPKSKRSRGRRGSNFYYFFFLL